MTRILAVMRRLGIRTHRDFRLFIRFVALAGGLFAAYHVNRLFQQDAFREVIPWYLGLAAAALLEFIFADVLADRSFPFDTERKLLHIEAKLGLQAIELIRDQLRRAIQGLRACDHTRVASTVHLLTELAPTSDERYRNGLLQLTEYVGAKTGGKGRLNAITKGIIGVCVRTGKLETANFASAEEYRDSMLRNFGYTVVEVQQHSAAARSYLALPLRSKDDARIIGAIFFFSTEPQIFPWSADSKEIEATAAHIVDLLELGGLV